MLFSGVTTAAFQGLVHLSARLHENRSDTAFHLHFPRTLFHLLFSGGGGDTFLLRPSADLYLDVTLSPHTHKPHPESVLLFFSALFSYNCCHLLTSCLHEPHVSVSSVPCPTPHTNSGTGMWMTLVNAAFLNPRST